jgi:SAM-dependent methyltransferase
MNREARHLAAYGKHMLKAFASGRAREAAATGLAIVLRSLEAARDMWARPSVTCEFCGWRGRAFRTFVAGTGIRRGAVCPGCLSLERHRAFLPVFEAVVSGMPSPRLVLDVAPIAAFTTYCRRRGDVKYVSIDKSSPLAMARMRVEQLGLRTESVDVLVCYHVLDYVPDDLAALRELRRTLKQTGVGIFQEGVSGARTEEWSRPRADRQHRIRQYGLDFPDRLRDGGFAVMELRRAGRPVFLAASAPSVLPSRTLPADT